MIGPFYFKPLDEENLKSFEPQSKKIIIGSDSRCDWVIPHPDISSTHAFLIFQGDHWIINDLGSESGIFHNGERVEKATILPGEEFAFGPLIYNLEKVKVLETVAAADQSSSVIDNNQSNYHLSHEVFQGTHPDSLNFDRGAVEDISSYEQPFDLTKSESSQQLEVLVYSSGSIIGADYLKWPMDKLVLSSEPQTGEIFFPGLATQLQIDFDVASLKIKNAPGFTTDGKIRLNEKALFLNFEFNQISLRLVDHSFKTRPVAWWVRDREFLKQLAIGFAALFLPLLLLLLIDLPAPPEKEEEVTIIYKEINPPAKVEEEKIEQEKKVAETPKQEDVKPAEKIEAPKPIVSKEKPEKAQALAPKPSPEKPVVAQQQPAPKKTFSFKPTVDLKAPSVAGTIATKSLNAPTKDTSSGGMVNVASAINNINRGGNPKGSMGGFDVDGKAAASTGPRGLSNKKGFDSAYIEPKTVVLGSIDPELLRKILQEYLPQFRHCYQQELNKVEDLKGVVDLNFTIGTDGKVIKTDIRPKDARFSRKGTGCIANVLKIIDFPKPKGGGTVDVRQPLSFFSEKEKI
jgi:outer membrane biosynthesis protein TonB